MRTSNKKSAQQLILSLHQYGVKHIVISPGSRNAPLVIGFTSHQNYTCHSVPDERAAGFIALGMADELKQPVALVCSSGSALLNYYPAISEAFYRNIPLVILSADRPKYLIDQGDGQTLHQDQVYNKHILFEDVLKEVPINEKEEWFNLRKIQEALNLATGVGHSAGGPVHLNVPFQEPLYDTAEITHNEIPIVNHLSGEINLSIAEKELVQGLIESSPKVMLLIGQHSLNDAQNQLITQLSSRILVLSETTSNSNVTHSITAIDRLIMPFSEEEKQAFQPDLLITIGSNIVSKKIKGYLRGFSPKHHLNLEHSGNPQDTYQALSHVIHANSSSFLEWLGTILPDAPNPWVKRWVNVDHDRRIKHQQYLESVPFTDIKVMQLFSEMIPDNAIVHLANSTPVRYAQLFNWNTSLEFKSNRGTSGIDGIVSTAVGNAMVTEKLVFLIVGDISFFYDTNAWWHNQVPSNLRVIVVNNSGGGIFRFIEGPASTGYLEEFFETNQKNSVERIAKGYDVNYFCAENQDEFKIGFSQLVKQSGAGIMEVKTPKTKNSDYLKNYFKNLH